MTGLWFTCVFTWRLVFIGRAGGMASKVIVIVCQGVRILPLRTTSTLHELHGPLAEAVVERPKSSMLSLKMITIWVQRSIWVRRYKLSETFPRKWPDLYLAIIAGLKQWWWSLLPPTGVLIVELWRNTIDHIWEIQQAEKSKSFRNAT